MSLYYVIVQNIESQISARFVFGVKIQNNKKIQKRSFTSTFLVSESVFSFFAWEEETRKQPGIDRFTPVTQARDKANAARTPSTSPAGVFAR